MSAPIRVLVIDDSAFARKVLREVLEGQADIEVVGIAHNGLDGLEKIAELRPDVVTLDLVMPVLDGLGLLRGLAGPGAPRVVVVSSSDAGNALTLEALEAGAVDFVHKPTSLATDRLYELGHELAAKVRAAASARPRITPVPPFPPRTRKLVRAGTVAPLVVVGTSTGGPQALTRLLSMIPADFPSPMAIALHIPPGYTEALAQRLDRLSALEVVEARDGIELLPGRVVVAQAGFHLKLDGDPQRCLVRLDLSPSDVLHRPSVDVLFRSAALGWEHAVIGLVMTGMGNDGLEGARAIKAAGGRMVTESASSCVIYGMPRCVEEAGLSDVQAPLDELAETLMQMASAAVVREADE